MLDRHWLSLVLDLVPYLLQFFVSLIFYYFHFLRFPNFLNYLIFWLLVI